MVRCHQALGRGARELTPSRRHFRDSEKIHDSLFDLCVAQRFSAIKTLLNPEMATKPRDSQAEFG